MKFGLQSALEEICKNCAIQSQKSSPVIVDRLRSLFRPGTSIVLGFCKNSNINHTRINNFSH